MKQIVIVSGKGGTGKTSVTAALATLLPNATIADCDVDAANLHLILPISKDQEFEFRGGKKAHILPESCVQCGKCREVCEFRAISENFVVDPLKCEGCGACYFLCPAEAIDFQPNLDGHWYASSLENGQPFVHAELLPGQENSGKLVAEVRKTARNLAEEHQNDYVLIDGPPGIGCPVISSLTGTDYALIVSEPTISGMHDLERIARLSKHFKIDAGVVVNKADLSEAFAQKIETYCREEGLHFLGTIPYDLQISEAQKNAQTILQWAPDSEASTALKAIYQQFIAIIQ